MADAQTNDTARLESRSLTRAMWGNLFMGATGIVAGFASNSGAIMMDGLFSMIGFGSALLGRRITRRLDAAPDRLRPFGYAADEAIFVTFRSLSLLGLVLFAVTMAAKNIYDYLTGTPPESLNFGPMIGYFILIGATCAGLWLSHYRAWTHSGRQSDILMLESRAAAFDGAITVSAGVGLAAIYLLRDGWLAPIAPVGDSIIVIFLCLAAIGQYFGGFRAGLAELAGVSAAPAQIALARRAARPALAGDGGRLTDLSVVKIGRSHLVTVYYDPGRPIEATTVDRLNLRLLADIRAALPRADVLLLITGYGRAWPPELLHPAPTGETP